MENSLNNTSRVSKIKYISAKNDENINEKNLYVKKSINLNSHNRYSSKSYMSITSNKSNTTKEKINNNNNKENFNKINKNEIFNRNFTRNIKETQNDYSHRNLKNADSFKKIYNCEVSNNNKNENFTKINKITFRKNSSAASSSSRQKVNDSKKFSNTGTFNEKLKNNIKNSCKLLNCDYNFTHTNTIKNTLLNTYTSKEKLNIFNDSINKNKESFNSVQKIYNDFSDFRRNSNKILIRKKSSKSMNRNKNSSIKSIEYKRENRNLNDFENENILDSYDGYNNNTSIILSDDMNNHQDCNFQATKINDNQNFSKNRNSTNVKCYKPIIDHDDNNLANNLFSIKTKKINFNKIKKFTFDETDKRKKIINKERLIKCSNVNSVKSLYQKKINFDFSTSTKNYTTLRGFIYILIFIKEKK